MKELLISWKPTFTIPSGESVVRRIYRWGSYVGTFCKKEWTVEQRTPIQESPCSIEECSPVFRAAPPATIDDAWEETYIDHGIYQSVEGSLLQIRINSTNYKKQIMTAVALGCSIDSSSLRMCEAMFLPVEPVEPVGETPVPPPVLSVLPVLPVLPVPSQEGRRLPLGGRKQPLGDRRQQQGNPSRSNGGAPRGRMGVAPVHRTLSVTLSGWLGTEE